jgi:hypothetical protein
MNKAQKKDLLRKHLLSLMNHGTVIDPSDGNPKTTPTEAGRRLETILQAFLTSILEAEQASEVMDKYETSAAKQIQGSVDMKAFSQAIVQRLRGIEEALMSRSEVDEHLRT